MSNVCRVRVPVAWEWRGQAHSPSEWVDIGSIDEAVLIQDQFPNTAIVGIDGDLDINLLNRRRAVYAETKKKAAPVVKGPVTPDAAVTKPEVPDTGSTEVKPVETEKSEPVSAPVVDDKSGGAGEALNLFDDDDAGTAVADRSAPLRDRLVAALPKLTPAQIDAVLQVASTAKSEDVAAEIAKIQGLKKAAITKILAEVAGV